jgi:preprotein translocase subunit SecD
MLSFPRWRVYLCLAAVLLGVMFTAPNVLPDSVLAKIPSWAPHQKLNLGLDLQGGSHLLLEVDTAALKVERLTNLVEDTRKTLGEAQIAFTNLNQANGVVQVRITDPAQLATAQAALVKLGQPMTGGGRDVSVSSQPDQQLQLRISDQALVMDSSKAVDQSIEIIRRRIDALGTREPNIVRQGVNRIVVEAPGESDPERLKSVIGQTAKLTFQMVDDSVPVQEAVAGRVPPDSELLPDQDAGPGGPPILVKRRALVSGEMLTSASQSFDQNNRPAISFRFNGAGAQRFAQATTVNVGKRFAIVLDNKVLSAPNILEPITGGSGEITGNFTLEQASNLALMLRSGALPAPLKIIQQSTVGAELGADSVRAGALAGIIAIAAIAVFMILAYGFVFGGISVAALVLNMVMILGAMSMIGASLTLPGIAGLILTVAMAVDANVLIFERIRDEERAGRKPALAIDTGFSRATVSILDANITTLIAALILFQFGAGPVRGFAWTLSIGVLASVFSALFITRMLIVWWYRSIRDKRLPI